MPKSRICPYALQNERKISEFLDGIDLSKCFFFAAKPHPIREKMGWSELLLIFEWPWVYGEKTGIIRFPAMRNTMGRGQDV